MPHLRIRRDNTSPAVLEALRAHRTVVYGLEGKAYGESDADVFVCGCRLARPPSRASEVGRKSGDLASTAAGNRRLEGFNLLRILVCFLLESTLGKSS